MEFMASSVKSLLNNLNIDRVFLTGHSLGGYVALAFLENFPKMLSGYCLFHSQPFSDTEAAIEKRKREIEIVKAGKKNLMYPDNIERMFAKPNLDKFTSALERSKTIASKIPGAGIIAVLNGMMARPSRLKVMEEGRVPCLWILGTMDSYIPVEVTSKVKLPLNAELKILKESGHLGFIEQEEESVKVFTAFAEKL
jgi:pimeloyl-ACP methyl ester carboxylesterase